MDRDSIDVAIIADNDPTGFAVQFRSRKPSRFEERSEHYLTAISSVFHRKASFHIRHHDVDFPSHAKRPRSNDQGNMDSWRITELNLDPDCEDRINAALKRVKMDHLGEV